MRKLRHSYVDDLKQRSKHEASAGKQHRIAFICNDHAFRVRAASHLGACLEAQVSQFHLGADAIDPDVDILIMEYPGRCAEDTLNEIRAWRKHAGPRPTVLIATFSTIDEVIQALRCGVNDYLESPVSLDQLTESVRGLLGPGAVKPEAPLLGESESMRTILELVARAAMSDANVLITGETGTGKELVASAIHHSSRRAHRPFICVNCAAIPDDLLESELFGYEKGAFTGAYSARDGKVGLAAEGTLFLDEIGEMSLYAQAKVLRLIDAHQFWALGSKRPSDVNIRIVAATNRNVESLAKANAFRADLFYRLNVARIHLPPLRERIEDLPILLEHFVRRFSRRRIGDQEQFDAETIKALQSYEWPGNIRELRNLVESLFVSLPPRNIGLSQLPVQMRIALDEQTSSEDRLRLIEVLTSTNWNVSRAAQKLNWSRMTMYRKMTRYQVARSPERVVAR
jgi:DNA-binding NtrC family response regulator